MFTTAAPPSSPSILRGQLTAPESTLLLPPNPTPWPGPGFKETAFLYAVSAAALTHTLARACSAGRMERCTCDDSPGLESRQAWQWGVCGDNLKYSTKFLNNFLGPAPSGHLPELRAPQGLTQVARVLSTSPVSYSPPRVK